MEISKILRWLHAKPNTDSERKTVSLYIGAIDGNNTGNCCCSSRSLYYCPCPIVTLWNGFTGSIDRYLHCIVYAKGVENRSATFFSSLLFYFWSVTCFQPILVCHISNERKHISNRINLLVKLLVCTLYLHLRFSNKTIYKVPVMVLTILSQIWFRVAGWW